MLHVASGKEGIDPGTALTGVCVVSESRKVVRRDMLSTSLRSYPHSLEKVVRDRESARDAAWDEVLQGARSEHKPS